MTTATVLNHRLRFAARSKLGAHFGALSLLETSESEQPFLYCAFCVVDRAAHGFGLSDTMAPIERLQLLPGFIEWLEEEDMLCRNQRQACGSGACMEKEDAA